MDQFVNETCQFPQLTLGGVLDGYLYGKDLWAVYLRRENEAPAILPEPKICLVSIQRLFLNKGIC